ncbi:MAG: ABC transporter permease [Acidimicrobiales bacterium]
MTMLGATHPEDPTGLVDLSIVTAVGPVAPAKRRGRGALRTLLTTPGGAVGSIIVAGLVFLAVFGPSVAPYSSTSINVLARLQGPSWHHLLGTDQLGRDLLSRLIDGTRIELEVAVPAVGIALVGGLILGLLGGYLGGLVDNVVVLLTDTFQSFPAIVLALALLTVLGSSLRNLIVVIAVTFSPNYARTSRALVLSVKQNQYIVAERALGASRARVMVRHILPNIVAPLFILLAMDTPSAITAEAGLSFLGLGVRPPNPSWGSLLSDGFNSIFQAPWAVLFASLALAIATVGFLTFGEALRDVLDPRLKGVTGWRA